MSAVPKHRISKSRRRDRRGHLALKKPNLSPCPNCNKLREPHTVCPFCGYYDGKEIKQ